ncbi:hypothetical protein Bb109J_c1218 [Bdellovibrio bacteriovorus]|nr:hypothetical protein Bb109J_c1218 [Bdellovibrio bacteriovorus]
MDTPHDSEIAEREVRRKTLWVIGLTFILPVLITLCGIYYVVSTGK